MVYLRSKLLRRAKCQSRRAPFRGKKEFRQILQSPRFRQCASLVDYSCKIGPIPFEFNDNDYMIEMELMSFGREGEDKLGKNELSISRTDKAKTELWP